MYTTYRIPATLRTEIDQLESFIHQYHNGTLSAAELKSRRVPFGIYEQRTAGTYMVRIRCAGGIIFPVQLKRAAILSQTYGTGRLHITTRQELQIHDVKMEHLVPVVRSLAEVNLSTRGGGGNTVRNITASWDCGISDREVFDVTPYAIELTSRFVELPNSWLLPRKFKIAFSNSLEDSAFATVNDLGFIARIQHGIRGFMVFVAGGMGSAPQPGFLLHEFIPAGDVFSVAEAVKRLFSKDGNRRNRHRARLRFLWNSFGKERFIERYNEEFRTLQKENSSPFIIDSTLSGRSGLTKNTDAQKSWYVYPEHTTGLNSVKIPFLLGDISAQQAEALCSAAPKFNCTHFRFSPDQNIVLNGIEAQFIETALALSPAKTLHPLFGNAVACAGASTCQLGICRSRDVLSAIVECSGFKSELFTGAETSRLHISGCSNSCGQHGIADLGFFGKTGRYKERSYPMYSVTIGASIDPVNGTRLSKKIDELPAKRLPEFIVQIFSRYRQHQKNGGSFRQYLAYAGENDIHELCASLQIVNESSDIFNDFGSDVPFSLESRGAGECMAGLFDLIDLDIAKSREELAIAQKTPHNSDSRWNHLRTCVYHAARALLVTKGSEALQNDAVFSEFTTYFTDEGATYAALFEVARTTPHELEQYEEAIISFVQTIVNLSQGLDDTLQFSAQQNTQEIHREMDLRGVACPMNFVKTKFELAKINNGELLKILLDNGAPIENVPRSVASEGHTIVYQQKKDHYWEVVIKKAE